MKEKIKMTLIGKILLKIKRKSDIEREIKYDKKMYKENNVYSEPNTINKISYNMIRVVHSVEKGLSNEHPRPFGINPTNELMRFIKQYESLSNKHNFSYNMTLTCLNNYIKFYEEKEWINEVQYKKVKEFIKNRKYENVDAGSRDITIDELNKGMTFDYKAFLKTRHSVRKFSNKKVPENMIKEVLEAASLTPSACNRQMIKVYDVRSKDNVDYITKKAQGIGGFETNNISYLVITFDLNSEYFIGERNQGWFNAGLFSMNLVNEMHSKGIGSCFIQFGNTSKEEEQIKKKLSIPCNERIAVFIAYGYYDKISKVPFSTRKDINEILRKR